MQNPVSLSIIMPVFNHPDELRMMIDSILSNTFGDWELLAVDDGSGTETKSVLSEFALRDKRIRIIERDREPKGAPTCRNIGLDMASGELVIFVDSDDYVKPFCFEQRVREIKSHPEFGFMCFRNGVLIDGMFKDKYKIGLYGYGIYQDDIAAFCQRTLPFVTWNNIYRRRALLDFGIRWDSKLLALQDAQFNLDCLLAGINYDYSSCPADYGYRIGTANSVSKKICNPDYHFSNQYAVDSFFRKVRERFGYKYDYALKRGKLCISNSEKRILEMTGNNMKRMAFRLRRQIPHIFYLIWARYMERCWIPKQISNKL